MNPRVLLVESNPWVCAAAAEALRRAGSVPARELGIRNMLEKPLELTQLREAVTSLLESAEGEAEPVP